MFGMGFMELFLVAVVAIIALGPDKLPSAMVDIAKMFKKFKGSLDEAKSSLDQELKISDMKAEANKFKAQFEETKQSMKLENNLGFEEYGLKGDDLDLKGILDDDDDEEEDDAPEQKVVEKKPKKKKNKDAAFKTKKKKEVIKEENIQTAQVEDDNKEANKFKVDFDEEENKSENV